MPTVLVSESARRWAHQLDDLKERWHLRRESKRQGAYPHVTRSITGDGARHIPLDEFIIITRDLDEADLLAIKNEIDEIIAAIRFQLDEAGARVHSHGEYADPHWYAAAKYAAKRAGAHSQAIQNEMRNRRIIRQKNERPLAYFFMDIARQELSPEEFTRLKDMAWHAKNSDDAVP